MGKPTEVAAGKSPDVVALESKVADLLARDLARTAAEQESQAAALADGVIAAGKFKAAQRPELIELAKLDPERVRKLADGLPTTMQFGLQGSPGSADDSPVDVTATREFKIMTESMGYDAETAKAALIAQAKARGQNVAGD